MTADEDYWDFYTSCNRTARKEHWCGECGRAIRVGERYWAQGGRTDGCWEQHKTCAHCDEASEWLLEVCEGWVFDHREEDLRDHVIGDEKELRSRPLTRLVRWMAADWHVRSGQLRPLDDVRALTDEAIAAYRAQYRLAVSA
jgi:hypothetical protein